MKRRRLPLPAELNLPDSLESIERGRLAQAELFPERPDDSREGRLARLLGIPGVRCASDLDAPPAGHHELFTFQPASWELPGATAAE